MLVSDVLKSVDGFHHVRKTREPVALVSRKHANQAAGDEFLVETFRGHCTKLEQSLQEEPGVDN